MRSVGIAVYAAIILEFLRRISSKVLVPRNRGIQWATGGKPSWLNVEIVGKNGRTCNFEGIIELGDMTATRKRRVERMVALYNTGEWRQLFHNFTDMVTSVRMSVSPSRNIRGVGPGFLPFRVLYGTGVYANLKFRLFEG